MGKRMGLRPIMKTRVGRKKLPVRKFYKSNVPVQISIVESLTQVVLV